MSDGRNATLSRQSHIVPERKTKITTRARTLAREEFSRKRLSYVVGGVFVFFFGLLAIESFLTALVNISEIDQSGDFVADLLFLAIISVLSVNAFSRSYMYIHRNPFHGWLLFQRSLPVSHKEIVLARSLVMLPATVVMTAIFFGPSLILVSVFYDQFNAGQFLWFVLIWFGYALLSGGLNLFLELGLNGKVVAAMQFVWMVLLVGIVWLLDGELVLTTFEWAGSYGPLPAGLSLLAGGLLFALLAKATERRVGNRELSP